MNEAQREVEEAIRHAHKWLEFHEEQNKPLGPGQPRRGYIGLDHKLGENDSACNLCHAIAVLEGRLTPVVDA